MDIVLLFENIKKQDELNCREIRHLYIPQYEFFYLGEYKFRIRGTFTFEDVFHIEADRYVHMAEKVIIAKERKKHAQVVYNMIKDYINLLREIFIISEVFFYQHKKRLLNPEFMNEIKIHIHDAKEYSAKVKTGENIKWIGYQDFLYDVMRNGSITTF